MCFEASPYPVGKKTKFLHEVGGYVEESSYEQGIREAKCRSKRERIWQEERDIKLRRLLGCDYDERT